MPRSIPAPISLARVSLLLAAVLLLTPAPATAQTPAPRSAVVEMHQGRPVLVIDGEPMQPMLYALTDVPGGRWSWEELPQHNIARFCETGVRLYQVDLFFEHVWMPDGRIDPAMAQRQIRGVLDACPDASVFFRFHVTAPTWWTAAHPEEWVAYADTDYQPEQPYGLTRLIEDDLYPVRRVSLASDAWRTEATAQLTAFLDTLAATPEGHALVGVQVANGVYGEWHQWGFFYNEPDVSPVMERAFRAWLRVTYGTNEALQAAWNDPASTFETATVPDVDDRRTTHGIFRDPAREQRTIDYYRCMQEITAETILHFARTAKAAWPRPLVTGSFYGYFFSMFGRQATGGHLEMERVLASPDLDYLAGPRAYEPEAKDIGDPYRSRGLIPTVRLNGKLWLDEMDLEVKIPEYRTGRYEERMRTAVAALRRNVMYSHSKGQGLWFYDFGPAGVDLDGFYPLHKGAQGYWDHPALLRNVEALKALFEERLDEPYETGADVLFVYDTESAYYTASLHGTDPVSSTLIDYATLHAFRSGVVFDPIHLEDLDEVDLSAYRTVVFGNVFLLTEAQRAFIRREVARDGRHLVWSYAPGYTDGRRLDPAFITEVTGIAVEPTALSEAPTIVATPGGDTLRYTLGDEPLAPLFTVADPAAEVLGRYAETGEAAVARKALDDHTAWYVALPSTEPALLRHILHASGAHVYSAQGDIVYAGGGIVTLHTAEGGRRTVTLRNGTPVTLNLPPEPTTVLLDAETGDVLLGPPTIAPSPPRPSR